MKYKGWRKFRYIFWIAAVIFFMGVFLYHFDFLRPLERFLLDHKFRYLQQEDLNNKIVLIAIDEKSLTYYSRENTYWPWPREFYYILNEYVTESGAELVAFDILFDTPGFNRSALDGERSDDRFARSMHEAGNSILSIKSTPARQIGEVPPVTYPDRFLHSIEGSTPHRQPHVITSSPIKKFQSAAAGMGNTILTPDPDGIIRTVHMFDSLAHKGFVPSLAMAAFLELQPDSVDIKRSNGTLQVGQVKIPLDRNNNFLINWYEKGGVKDGTFPYYSFHQVVRSATKRLRDTSASVTVPPSVFEDKIVIVGASAAGLGDIKSTPMSSLEPFPGMEIQATVLNNLLERNFITTLPAATVWGILLLLIFGIVFLTAYMRPVMGGVSIGLILGGVLTLGLLFFQFDRIWFPTGLLFTMGMISYISSAVYKYFAEERQKKQIRSAFGHYVQPEFVEQLIENPELLNLGGEKKNLTVLFSDLAGFTAISETTPPEKLLNFLNQYLGVMTETIMNNHGTLDKYIGDAVMAFWGAPLDQEDHAIHACHSALRMLEKMHRADDLPPEFRDIHTHARFGINTGEMVVGNIGSKNHFNYTVLGDAVNLAARLEAANKTYGSQILISESTYRDLTDEFICRLIDLIVVKGKSKPVKVYELIADYESPVDFDNLNQGLSVYNHAIDLYYRREWSQAIQKFERVLDHFPDDGPSKTYIERCQKYQQDPPPKDWDGVFYLKTK